MRIGPRSYFLPTIEMEIHMNRLIPTLALLTLSAASLTTTAKVTEADMLGNAALPASGSGDSGNSRGDARQPRSRRLARRGRRGGARPSGAALDSGLVVPRHGGVDAGARQAGKGKTAKCAPRCVRRNALRLLPSGDG